MKNRIFIRSSFAAAALSLCANLACWGQAGVTPAAPHALPRLAAATPSPEDKEKAEDAALLKQLDAQQDVSEPRVKGQFPALRGGGGVGVATAGTAFKSQTWGVRNQDFLTRPKPASRALIVRTSESDPKTETALEEDLTVMSHLLNKALEELPGGPGNGKKVMGIDVFFSPYGSPLRTLYLDNYGAVFFLNVNFPLIAPAEKHPEEKPTGDTAWEEARQEVYGKRFPNEELAEQYSQEKVDRLKDTLYEALKNATNIRGLKPEEFVTLWVCGGNSNGPRYHVVKNGQPGNGGMNVIGADQLISGGRRTILTIRARKSEIDDYAKGKVSPEEFQKHSRLTAYTGDGGGGLETLLIGGYTPRNEF